jgi:hypothetical protein
MTASSIAKTVALINAEKAKAKAETEAKAKAKAETEAKAKAETEMKPAKQQTLDELLVAAAAAAAACYTRCCSDGATADTATAVADAAELLAVAIKRNRLLVAAEIETDPAASYKLEWLAGFY